MGEMYVMKRGKFNDTNAIQFVIKIMHDHEEENVEFGQIKLIIISRKLMEQKVQNAQINEIDGKS